MNIFDRIIDWLDNGEHSFVTFLSKVIPLLVPLIPAYVGYDHVVRELGFKVFFGITYGMVIEGLGYSAIFKAVQFWENNRHYTKSENKAPLFVAVIIYIVYLMVILSVNVMLDWQSGVVWWKVVAIGLISLMSVPAGLLMSISAVHTERIRQRENERLERKERKNEQRQPERKRTANRSLGGSFVVRQKIRQYVRSVQTNEHRTPGPTEIANELGVSKGYASDTLKSLAEEKPTITY